MKKLLHGLFFACTIALPESSTNILHDFKERLCKHQRLMSHEKYIAFIDPYMQEAERHLKVAQYYLASNDSSLREEYLNALIQYNLACFYSYKSDFISEASENRILRATKNLQNILLQIKNNGLTPSLDVQKEFAATSELLQRANKEYYKESDAQNFQRISFLSILSLLFR